MLRWLLLFLLAPSLASAQSYLIEPSLAQCQARSAQQCTALGCDGVQTKYWWSCQVFASPTVTGGASGAGGTSGLTIIPGDGWYDVTTTNSVAKSPTGLTPQEQAAIQTQAQLGTALPYMISQPTWKALFTAQQIATINANATLKAEMTAILATNPINLTLAEVQTFCSAALAAGAIGARVRK